MPKPLECSQQLMQGYLLQLFKDEMQMGELIDVQGGEFETSGARVHGILIY
jgi:hypothetical protein